MKIEIPLCTISEVQKAKIVSRGEQLPSGNLNFEITAKYATILARMSYTGSKDEFQVFSDRIFFRRIYIDKESGYDEEGEWEELIHKTYPSFIIAKKFADGEIELGENIDTVMAQMEEIYQRIDEIKENNKHIEQEKAEREAIEKPIRKAKEKAEKEAKEAEEKKQKAELQAKEQAHYEMKKGWIEDHGSERLRKGFALGHACNALYETELGKFFIVDDGYEYDRDQKVETRDKSCPSLKAIEEVERVQGIDGLKVKIIWLPHGLEELHSIEGYIDEPEEGSEAVQVDVEGTSGYWYKKI